MVQLTMCMLGFLLTGTNMQPMDFQVDNAEGVQDLLLELFIEDVRNGRNLEEEADDKNNIEKDNIDEKEASGKSSNANPEEVAKFNNYMDAVFRRMNAALRAKLMDPMELNLNHKGRNNGEKKKKDEQKVKRRIEREAPDIEVLQEDSNKLQDRIGSVKKDMIKKKKKEVKGNDRKNKNKNKGGNKGKDKKVKAKNKADRQKKREEKREEKRRKKKEKNARKVQELSRDKRTKQSKEKLEKHTGRSNKKDGEEGKAVGSLSGIATLRRSGDVTIEKEESHLLVTSLFTVGPLRLEVSKSLGHGKARTVKTAKATTDLMTGVMVLKVKPDGSAHVKKVVFKKPDNVAVSGSIADKKERSENILKNSFNRSRPLAAQRILKTARYVLKGSTQSS